MSQVVRIDERTHEKLRALAEREKEPMGVVLAKALEAYEERSFWASFEAGYSALRSDSHASAAEREERALWEGTLGDGLADEEPYPG
jgi:predicted transcriptional regulator